MGRLFGLTHRAIRFYEERGLITPRRDRTNRRRFSRGDRARLQVIALLRTAGLSLEEVRAILAAPAFEARSLAARFLSARTERLRRELNAAGLALERMKSSELF